jgi:hypothetical protein
MEATRRTHASVVIVKSGDDASDVIPNAIVVGDQSLPVYIRAISERCGSQSSNDRRLT